MSCDANSYTFFSRTAQIGKNIKYLDLEKHSEVDIKYLFNEFYEKLCLYARGFVKDSHAAEEIVEDLFVYLWLHSANLRINTSFKSYLFRSVRNNCLKYLSRNRSSRHEPIPGEKAMDELEQRHFLSEEIPLSLIISRELEEKTDQVLESLPGQCRKIYLLSCHENMTYSEIAEKLNISVGTVKTQMFRAFQKLRDGLKDFLQ